MEAQYTDWTTLWAAAQPDVRFVRHEFYEEERIVYVGPKDNPTGYEIQVRGKRIPSPRNAPAVWR